MSGGEQRDEQDARRGDARDAVSGERAEVSKAGGSKAGGSKAGSSKADAAKADVSRAGEKARRRIVFDDPMSGRSRDDSDAGWGREGGGSSRDRDWYLSETPPHHGEK
ncbi:hypothetical protein ABH931_001700 [Streptacidiphilus sp. MAP12-33]|uniref:hypothetical protein n=1 Tax=Streptacidiphilus sp. MAP12-33 TaxID=3156266 RepID=UPI003511CE5B